MYHDVYIVFRNNCLRIITFQGHNLEPFSFLDLNFHIQISLKMMYSRKYTVHGTLCLLYYHCWFSDLFFFAKKGSLHQSVAGRELSWMEGVQFVISLYCQVINFSLHKEFSTWHAFLLLFFFQALRQRRNEVTIELRKVSRCICF